jgi:hypothetical protein
VTNAKEVSCMSAPLSHALELAAQAVESTTAALAAASKAPATREKSLWTERALGYKGLAAGDVVLRDGQGDVDDRRAEDLPGDRVELGAARRSRVDLVTVALSLEPAMIVIADVRERRATDHVMCSNARAEVEGARIGHPERSIG